jgi:predicted anti-sigma-YlaC factor YlaD
MGEIRSIECERTRQSVSMALDVELAELDRARVAAHLGRCEACRSFQDGIGGVAVAVRSAPLERVRFSVALPASRNAGWGSVRRLASAGAAAAVVAAAFLGFAAAPDRSTWHGDGVLIASALDRPAGTNELLIDVIRPTLTSRQHEAIAFGEGGIGAYKPPLSPGV